MQSSDLIPSRETRIKKLCANEGLTVIDWNALGTWAAVVVALGISLKETWYRQRERSARHLVVAGEIFPAVSALHDALKETGKDAALIVDSENRDLLADVNATYESLMAELSLEPWRPRLEQPDALPEHLLIPLYKSLTLMRMLEHNAHARASSAALDVARERAHLTEWMEQGESIRRSLSWVVQHSQYLMASRRWMHPEASAGYAILPERSHTP